MHDDITQNLNIDENFPWKKGDGLKRRKSRESKEGDVRVGYC